MPNFNIFNKHETMKGINNFRNTFGESVSLYLYWTYHLFFWSFYLCLFIISLWVVDKMMVGSNKSFTLHGVELSKWTDYLYVLVFLLWSNLLYLYLVNFYMLSWKAKEKIYSIKWGTYSNNVILDNDREEFECDQSVKIISTRIPIENRFKKFISFTTSFVITLIMVMSIFILDHFDYFISYNVTRHTDTNSEEEDRIRSIIR